jgi:hypothetical protein
MKSIEIKILVTIFVITLAACSSINRKRATKVEAESKVVVSTKSDGSGSWNEGYESPYIEIIQNGITTKTGRYFFKPNAFTDQLGWIFEWRGAVVKTNVDLFLKVDANGRTYVPWRFWNSWGIEKSSEKYKMLVGNLVNDEGISGRLRFNMPWAFWSSYISDGEMNTLADIVSTGSVRQTNNIASAKKSILFDYQFLQDAKFALDIMKNEATALKAQLQKNITENIATLVQRRASLDAVKLSYETSSQSLLELRAQLAGVKQQVALLNSESDNKLKLTDNTQRIALFKDNEKDIISQKEKITTLFTKFSTLAKTVNFTPIMVPAMIGDTTTLISLFLGVSNI